ncbi:unnamed protein product, partial [Closterium sp. Yama58-4]
RRVLLSDTVGFISDLPHQLVEAFHATLEEVVEADLLLHVVDASAPDMHQQRQAVMHVLTQMGVPVDPGMTADVSMAAGGSSMGVGHGGFGVDGSGMHGYGNRKEGRFFTHPHIIEAWNKVDLLPPSHPLLSGSSILESHLHKSTLHPAVALPKSQDPLQAQHGPLLINPARQQEFQEDSAGVQMGEGSGQLHAPVTLRLGGGSTRKGEIQKNLVEVLRSKELLLKSELRDRF